MSEAPKCRGCGAPLAEDQRYCLNCGARRGEPRVDFRSYEKQASSPEPRAPETKRSRDYTPLAAVGGIAVLGAMLLIGVLIGRGGGNDTVTTPAPVVVQGGGGGGGQSTATKEDGGGAGGQSKPAKSKSGGKGKGGGTVSGGSSNTGSAPVASDAELQQLQEQSPQEYAENSAKLPDEIATGGAPPPEDSKAPGGGGKGTAIE